MSNKELTFREKVNKIQTELKVPKNQFNKFGGYAFRSLEDILEAVKPKLSELGLLLQLSDEMVEVGGRVYVKSTSVLTDGEHSVTATGFAREAESQKGMNDSQLSGATSSYSMKYSLSRLLLLDDTKDSDATNTHGKEDASEGKPKKKTSSKMTKKEEKEVEVTEELVDKTKTTFRRKRL